LPVLGLGIALQYLSPQVTLLILGLAVGIGIPAAPGGNRMTEKRNAGGRKMSCPGVFPGSARELAAGRWPGPSCRTAWVGARGLQPRGRPFNRRHPTADQRIEGSEVGGCVRGGLADVDRDGC
jgi:hypothetical protein